MTFSKLTYLKDLRGHDMPNGAYRVLVAVFNYTNASGEGAHPGERRLADDTGLSVRSVRDHLKWLTEHGYVQRGRRGHGSGGRGIATRYAVTLPAESRAEDDAPTGEIPSPTGEIASTYRQNCVDLPAKSRPLSDLLSDPLPDHEQQSLAQQRALLEWMKDPSSPGHVA
jgi:DNA-binding transcriptional MocR family regulator